ncbi:hypothetical protein BS78_K330000 [Paspalum vaginatum]|uniref:F-box domain-containing protein n=1 Tax=Paspalum vaginatum TaxID=158149 RepID=A0A9W7XE95_9POAL|nr:hypothetical protein BS78_K330000 [Paspalum vaginatum]
METPTAGDDRLSGLPDSLLEYVLSRLPSRQAARTSVLSRRWRHLWRTLPCVDVDQREFRTARANELNAFKDLADVLLPPHCASRPPPDLETLRLRVSCRNFPTAHRWIRRGLRRHPAAFYLRCYKDDNVINVFDRSPTVAWPEFPGLTQTLHLSGLSLSSDFAKEVADEYHVLETLHLDDCRHKFTRLASRSLKELSPLLPAVPNVVSLRLHGRGGTARVNTEYARALNLSGFRFRALLGGDNEAPDGFPVFHNLRALHLHECNVGVVDQMLLRFLQNSPSLETLKVSNGALWSMARPGPAVYECKNIRSIELEFWGRCAVDELAETLVGSISKQAVQPIQTSVGDGKSRVKISFA